MRTKKEEKCCNCYKGFIISSLVRAKLLSDTERWKEAMDEAWNSLYIIQTLEFHICPEKKHELMPARLAINDFIRSIEAKDKPKIEASYSKAVKEVHMSIGAAH